MEILTLHNFGWLVAIGGGGLTLLALIFQDYFLYFPTIQNARKRFLSPLHFKLPEPQSIHVTTSDNVKVNLWLFKQDIQNRPTILSFHGNAGNISFTLPTVTKFYRQLNYNVVLMEYRGFGRSEGWPHQKGIMKDVRATIEYIKQDEQLKNTKLFLFGQSLGGAVAIHTAAHADCQNHIAGVIVENTFTSVLDMIDFLIPILKPVKFLVRNPWRSDHEIRKILCPMLMLSGAKDQLVPPKMLAKLKDIIDKEKRNDDVTLLSFPDGEHLDTFLDPDYFSSIGLWINARL